MSTRTVRSGESWESIAGDVYGDQRMFKVLADANGGLKRVLQPGDVINLPSKQESPYISEKTMEDVRAFDASLGWRSGAGAATQPAAASTSPQAPGGTPTSTQLQGFANRNFWEGPDFKSATISAATQTSQPAPARVSTLRAAPQEPTNPTLAEEREWYPQNLKPGDSLYLAPNGDLTNKKTSQPLYWDGKALTTQPLSEYGRATVNYLGQGATTRGALEAEVRKSGYTSIDDFQLFLKVQEAKAAAEVEAAKQAQAAQVGQSGRGSVGTRGQGSFVSEQAAENERIVAWVTGPNGIEMPVTQRLHEAPLISLFMAGSRFFEQMNVPAVKAIFDVVSSSLLYAGATLDTAIKTEIASENAETRGGPDLTGKGIYQSPLVAYNPVTMEKLSESEVYQRTIRGLPIAKIPELSLAKLKWDMQYKVLQDVWKRSWGPIAEAGAVAGGAWAQSGFGASPGKAEQQTITLEYIKEQQDEVANAVNQSANYRRVAHAHVREGDVELALDSIMKAQEFDARTRLFNPYQAYSWSAEPWREQAYKLAAAQFELQKGSPLTDAELYSLQNVYANPGLEMTMSIVFDLYNLPIADVVIGGMFGKLVKATKLDVVGKVIAEGISNTPIIRSMGDWFTKLAVKSQGELLWRSAVDFGYSVSQLQPIVAAADKSTDLVRFLDDIAAAASGNIEAVARLESSGLTKADIQMAARLVRDVSPDGLDAAVKAGKMTQARADQVRNALKGYQPDEWGRRVGEIYDDRLETSFNGHVTRLTEERRVAEMAGDAKKLAEQGIREEAEKLAHADVKSGIVMQQWAADLKEAWLKAHRPVPGASMYDDSLIYAIAKRAGVTSDPRWENNVRRWVGAWDRFRGGWVYATLALRPAWFFRNMVDTTTRLFLGGGTEAVNTLVHFHDELGKIINDMFIPGDVKMAFSRTFENLDRTVAERFIAGERMNFPYYQHFWGEAWKKARVGKKGAWKFATLVPDSVKAFGDAWKDMNALMEFAERTSMLYNQFMPVFQQISAHELGQWTIKLGEAGLSQVGIDTMRFVWQASGGQPSVMVSMLDRLVGKEASQLWSVLLPKEVGSMLASLPPDVKAKLIEPIMRELESHIVATGGLNASEVQKFFENVKEALRGELGVERARLDALRGSTAGASTVAQSAGEMSTTVSGQAARRVESVDDVVNRAYDKGLYTQKGDLPEMANKDAIKATLDLTDEEAQGLIDSKVLVKDEKTGLWKFSDEAQVRMKERVEVTTTPAMAEAAQDSVVAEEAAVAEVQLVEGAKGPEKLMVERPYAAALQRRDTQAAGFALEASDAQRAMLVDPANPQLQEKFKRAAYKERASSAINTLDQAVRGFLKNTWPGPLRRHIEFRGKFWKQYNEIGSVLVEAGNKLKTRAVAQMEKMAVEAVPLVFESPLKALLDEAGWELKFGPTGTLDNITIIGSGGRVQPYRLTRRKDMAEFLSAIFGEDVHVAIKSGLLPEGSLQALLEEVPYSQSLRREIMDLVQSGKMPEGGYLERAFMPEKYVERQVTAAAGRVRAAVAADIAAPSVTVHRGVSAATPVDEGMYGKGEYWTENADYATNYAAGGGEARQGALRLEKPFRVTSNELDVLVEDDLVAYRKAHPDAGVKEMAEQKSRLIREKLEAQGYDGIILDWNNRSAEFPGQREFVVFHPERSITDAVVPTAPKAATLLSAEDWTRGVKGASSKDELLTALDNGPTFNVEKVEGRFPPDLREGRYIQRDQAVARLERDEAGKLVKKNGRYTIQVAMGMVDEVELTSLRRVLAHEWAHSLGDAMPVEVAALWNDAEVMAEDVLRFFNGELDETSDVYALIAGFASDEPDEFAGVITSLLGLATEKEARANARNIWRTWLQATRPDGKSVHYHYVQTTFRGRRVLESPETFMEFLDNWIGEMEHLGIDESNIAAIRQQKIDLQGFMDMKSANAASLGIEPPPIYRGYSLTQPRVNRYDPGTLTWLLGTQDALARQKLYESILDTWSGALTKQLAENPSLGKLMAGSDIDIIKSLRNGFVDSKANAARIAMNGGEHPAIGTWKGALPKTNEYMLDYQTYTRFDEFMKNLYPFWMFPSRSIPFWVKTMADQPWIPAMYYKYTRWTNQNLIQKGMYNSLGEPLPSKRGMMRIPGTDIWVNPLSPLSFRYALMMFDRSFEYSGDEQLESMSMGEQVVGWLQTVTRAAGLDMPFWITSPAALVGIMDANKLPTYPPYAPLALIPRWWINSMADKVKVLDVVWDGFLHPDVPWKDSNVELWILNDILRRFDEAVTDTEKMEIIKEAKEALGYREDSKGNWHLAPRKDSPYWNQAEHEVDKSEYFQEVAGYFTGMYPQPFTDAQANIYAVRSYKNFLRDMINNETGAKIFGLDPIAENRYNNYVEKGFKSPIGQVASLYNNMRWVMTPGGEQLYGEDRRKAIAESIHEDEATSARWDAINEANGWLDAQLKLIPFGSETAATEDIWTKWSEWREQIERDPMYADARRSWSVGYKPESMLFDQYRRQFWSYITETRPQWDKENGEEYKVWQGRIAEWEKQIPMIAQAIINAMVSEKVVPSVGGREGARIVPGQSLPIAGRQGFQRYIDIDKLKTKLLQEATPSGYQMWSKDKATLYTAMDKAYDELYLNKFWEGRSGMKGYALTAFDEQFFATVKPPSDQAIIDYVLTNYPGRWTDEEIAQALEHSAGKVTAEERMEPTTEYEKQVQEVWDILNWAGPSAGRTKLEAALSKVGGNVESVTTWYDTNGTWGADQSNPKVKTKFEAFLSDLRRAANLLDLKPPTGPQLQELVQAEADNNAFKAQIAGQYGEGFWDLLTLYATTSDKAEKKKVRRENPEIDAYYKAKDAYAPEHQIWAKWYNPDLYRGEGGGGGTAGGAWSSLTNPSRAARAGAPKGGGVGGGKSTVSAKGSWVPIGFRSANYLTKTGSGGASAQPVYPKGFQAVVGKLAMREIEGLAATGAPLSGPTTQFLQNLIGRHPDWREFIESILSDSRRLLSSV